MPTNPRKDPTVLVKAKGKRKMTKDELAERESHEVYAAGGAILPPKGMKGRALEMFKAEAAYMERVNRETGKDFYGANDAAPLQIMCESHFRYLHYMRCEEKTNDPDKLRVYNQLKNKEAQTEKMYRQALKLDPASRVDFGAAVEVRGDGKEFNV